MSEASFDPTAIVAPESVGLCSVRLARLDDLMTVNHIGESIATHGPGYGFGLGFDVHADPGLSGSPKGVGAYAWGGYWHTGFWVDPGSELFVIMMAQLIPSDHVDTGEKLPHLVYQALLD